MNAPNITASNESATREMCAIAREIFQHALEESSIERGFSRNLHYERSILQVGDDLYDLGTFSRIFVVSFGKGAHSSLEALINRLGAGPGQPASSVRLPCRRPTVSASAISRAAIRCRTTNRCAPPRPFSAPWIP